MRIQPPILLIGRTRQNLILLAQILRKEGYQTLDATSYEEIHKHFDEETEFSLALLDLGGFDRRIWEHCEVLQRQGVPFLVISPRGGLSLQAKGLSHGARSVLVKPLTAKQLVGIVSALLESDE